MKKSTVLSVVMLLAFLLAACGQRADQNGTVSLETAGEESSVFDSTSIDSVDTDEEGSKEAMDETAATDEMGVDEEAEDEGGKTLVVYFSATGNTREVAGHIAEATDGDLFELVPVEPYSDEDLDYNNGNSRVVYEHDNPEARATELVETTVADWDSYDTVFIGFPIWWRAAAWPVEGFVTANDFTGKTVIPFCTSGSSELGESGALLAEAAGTGDWQEGGRFDSDDISEETVKAWVESLGLGQEESVSVGSGDTVASAIADPQNQQILYLWEEAGAGNMPSVTEYTQNNGNYADDPDFRPYVVTFPVPEGTPIKGAVLINAGGAFLYRSDQMEGTPVAEELAARGYQSFVVNYRLRPYTQEEGALDLARAVRFVRKNADVYGIDEKDIAVMGFSAGGILAGEMLLNFDGTVNGTALDERYVPDELDEFSADAGADGMIYSFYGRLSVASGDVEKFASSDLPPTYFCYGTRDPFVNQFEKCITALQEAGVEVEVDVLEGRPHGYGYTEGWIPAYDAWLEEVFAGN